MVSISSAAIPGGVGFSFAGPPGAFVGALFGTTVDRLDELERRVEELESRSPRSEDG